MENCVAPGLDEFDVIIRSCIVFSQSNYIGTRPITLALIAHSFFFYYLLPFIRTRYNQ